MQNATLWLLGLFSITACSAATVAAGTVLVIRLDSAVSSAGSQSGDRVSGVLVQTEPAAAGISLGARVDGVVIAAERKAPRDNRALLNIYFDSLHTADTTFPLVTRVLTVDNARESVDGEGVIHGIRPMRSRPSKLEGLLLLGTYAYPAPFLTYSAIKILFVKFRPRPGITFPGGTEVRVSLEEDFELPGEPPADVRPQEIPERLAAEGLVAQQPLRTTTPNSVLSDLTNLLFAGTAEQIAGGFAEAGWLSAEQLSLASKTKMFIAMIRRKAYPHGPVSPLLLQDRPPDLVFQKQLNTFAQRHHIRIWQTPQSLDGAPVWVASATHDIRIRFAPWARVINHEVESDLDVEREKVVADLQFQGRAASVHYVVRPHAPQALTNATGDRLVTDGQMALVVLQ